jgi:multiple sugar transport system permease protein
VGLFNRLLNAVGLPSQQFISSIDQALYSIVAMDAWRSFGFYTLLLLAALLNVPSLLYEAARIDGAGELLIFFRIALPLIQRTLLLVFVLAAIDGANVFSVPYYMTGFGPGRSTLTLAGLIYNEGLQNLNLGYASSVAIVLFVIIMVVTLIQLRLLRTNWEY